MTDPRRDVAIWEGELRRAMERYGRADSPEHREEYFQDAMKAGENIAILRGRTNEGVADVVELFERECACTPDSECDRCGRIRLLRPVRHRTSEGLAERLDSMTSADDADWMETLYEVANNPDRHGERLYIGPAMAQELLNLYDARKALLRSEPSERQTRDEMFAKLLPRFRRAMETGDTENAHHYAIGAANELAEPSEGREPDAYLQGRPRFSMAGSGGWSETVVSRLPMTPMAFPVYFGTPSDSPTDRCPQCGYEPAERIERGPLPPRDRDADSPTGEGETADQRTMRHIHEAEKGVLFRASDSPEREGCNPWGSIQGGSMAFDKDGEPAAEPAESEEHRRMWLVCGHSYRPLLGEGSLLRYAWCSECRTPRPVLPLAVPSPEGVEELREAWDACYEWCMSQDFESQPPTLDTAFQRWLATRTTEPEHVCEPKGDYDFCAECGEPIEADQLLLETLGWLEATGFKDIPGQWNGLIGRLRRWRARRPDPVASDAKVTQQGELLDRAWGIIANAYAGSWQDAPDHWREAAEGWRDQYLDRE